MPITVRKFSQAALLVCGLSVWYFGADWLRASAQSVVGRISGTVTDASGATVSGASVTITNDETKLTRGATTDENGFYIVTNLPAGNYSVGVERQGFKKALKTGFNLVSDGRLTVDFALEAGAVSETMEVTSSVGETVNNTSGEVARVVDGQQARDLALNARNYLQLATLIPGAPVLDDEDPLGQSVNGNTARPINGNRGNANNLTIDGGFNLDSGNIGNQTNNVGIDFIREVKIQTSNFSAEYGRQSGAAINITTRGGTNQFHGSLYEFLRNEQLDANNFFSNASQLPRPPLRFNNFGYSLGGPVRKDKLFFFVGQEWKYVRQGILPLRRTLPTRRELAGDFSARATLFLRDPAKTGACNATNQTACFPGNVIPAGRLSADGRAIAAFYLQSIGLAASFDDRPVANNAVFQNPSPYDFRQEFVRIDYQLSERHSIYGRYLHDKNVNIDPLGINNGNQLPNVPTRRNRPGTGLLLTHIWSITPRLVNEAKANASWNGQRIIAVETAADRAKYGFTFPQVFPAGGRFPNMSRRRHCFISTAAR